MSRVPKLVLSTSASATKGKSSSTFKNQIRSRVDRQQDA